MGKAAKIKLALLDNLVWVLVAVFFLLNAVFTPRFATTGNLLNILNQVAPLGLLVLAQGMVMLVGELDLSLDATLAFAPGVAVLMTAQSGVPGGIVILLTLLVGAAVGLFNGFFTAKLKANSFLATLSAQIVMRGLVVFLVPFALRGLSSTYTFLGRGRLFGAIQVAPIALLVIYLIFELVTRKTIFGRQFKLTGGNRRAAFISGISTDRVVITAFIIAGVLASVAGLIMSGRSESISNNMGLNMVTMAIAGAILGGSSFDGGQGKPIGLLGGALLLGMFDNALNLQGVEISLVDATKGALIFLAILLDRWRVRANAGVVHKENIKKLSGEHAGQPAQEE